MCSASPAFVQRSPPSSPCICMCWRSACRSNSTGWVNAFLAITLFTTPLMRIHTHVFIFPDIASAGTFGLVPSACSSPLSRCLVHVESLLNVKEFRCDPMLPLHGPLSLIFHRTRAILTKHLQPPLVDETGSVLLDLPPGHDSDVVLHCCRILHLCLEKVQWSRILPLDGREGADFLLLSGEHATEEKGEEKQFVQLPEPELLLLIQQALCLSTSTLGAFFVIAYSQQCFCVVYRSLYMPDLLPL